MSAVVDTHDHGHGHDHDEHGHHSPYGGVMRWITTTNHKDIGTLYLWFAGTMFFVGGMMAVLIRLERIGPEALREAVTESWLVRAPKRLVAAYEQARDG